MCLQEMNLTIGRSSICREMLILSGFDFIGSQNDGFSELHTENSLRTDLRGSGFTCVFKIHVWPTSSLDQLCFWTMKQITRILQGMLWHMYL